MEHRIVIRKAAALTFFVGEHEAQTSRINPLLADLAQTCDGRILIQARRQSVDFREITAIDEAIAVLDDSGAFACSCSLYPFVTIDDNLCAKWWIAANSNRDMTPFSIDQMKVVMLDIGPLLAMVQVRDLPLRVALDFPYGCGSISCDHQEQATIICVAR